MFGSSDLPATDGTRAREQPREAEPSVRLVLRQLNRASRIEYQDRFFAGVNASTVRECTHTFTAREALVPYGHCIELRRDRTVDDEGDRVDERRATAPPRNPPGAWNDGVHHDKRTCVRGYGGEGLPKKRGLCTSGSRRP